MPKSARYHIDRANSIVFTSKRLPLQPVSSERNHQVADKFRKMSCLKVYSQKRGRVGIKKVATTGNLFGISCCGDPALVGEVK